jgi:hypothetical protein
LVIAGMGGRLAGGVHELAAPHVVCAEHGDLTDVAHVTATSVAAVSDVSEMGAAPAEDMPGGHEHCPFAVVLEQTAPTPKLDRFVVLTIAPARPALLPAVSQLPAVQAPLLLAAPKTSPPVRG